MLEGTRDDRSQVREAPARPAGLGVSRAAKLLPPRDPSGTLDRTELEARLVAGTGRRLTIIVAGAGFGKSTLASRVARTRNAAGYTVDAALMARASKAAIFLHCLPAHRGEEVTDEVIDGPASRVWPQAANRLHTETALLYAMLTGDFSGELLG